MYPLPLHWSLLFSLQISTDVSFLKIKLKQIPNSSTKKRNTPSYKFQLLTFYGLSYLLSKLLKRVSKNKTLYLVNCQTWWTDTQTNKSVCFSNNKKSKIRLLLVLVNVIKDHFTILSSSVWQLFICRFVTSWCQKVGCSIRYHTWACVEQGHGLCSSCLQPLPPWLFVSGKKLSFP